MGNLTDKIRCNRSVVISVAIFALLFMSGFQTFVGAKTYELGAEQAYESCVQRSKPVERPRCEDLRPFWTRQFAMHSEHMTAVLNRAGASAAEIWDDSMDVVDHVTSFVMRRVRSAQRLGS